MYYLHWKNEYILVIDTSSILGPDDFCRYRIGRRSQRPVQHEDRDRNLDQGDTNVIELNLFPNANTSSANVPSSSTSVVPQNEIIYIDEEDEDINLDLSL